jgi:hypothetical protein
MSPITPAPIVHMPLGCDPLDRKKVEKVINICRNGARIDKVHVVIEKGEGARRQPILEITPQGDLREVVAPALRTTLGSLFPQIARAAARKVEQEKPRVQTRPLPKNNARRPLPPAQKVA